MGWAKKMLISTGVSYAGYFGYLYHKSNGELTPARVVKSSVRNGRITMMAMHMMYIYKVIV